MFYKTSFLGFILLASVVVCRGQISTSNGKKNVLYNILFISIDDLRTELNCYSASQTFRDKFLGQIICQLKISWRKTYVRYFNRVIYKEAP